MGDAGRIYYGLPLKIIRRSFQDFTFQEYGLGIDESVEVFTLQVNLLYEAAKDVVW